VAEFQRFNTAPRCAASGRLTSLDRKHCTQTEFGCKDEPSIERVQALADIFALALCCHSNTTRAPIANPSNSAQRGRGQTDSQTHKQTRETTIHFSRRLRLTRNVPMRCSRGVKSAILDYLLIRVCDKNLQALAYGDSTSLSNAISAQIQFLNAVVNC